MTTNADETGGKVVPVIVRKRGGQAEYVLDRQGNPVVGLSRNAHDGRYYATDSRRLSGKRKWFGRDYDRALILFREWQDAQSGGTVAVPEEQALTQEALWQAHDLVNELLTIWPDKPPVSVPDWLVPVVQDILAGRPVRQTVVIHHLVRSAAFWAAVRTVITTDPFLAEQKTGLPLSRLHQYKPLGPSPTLESLGTLYNEKSGATAEWLYKTRIFWDEFKSAVAVKTVREIQQASITAYYDGIISKRKSPTYAKHRFGAVKRVFTFAQSRGIAPEEIATILAYCKVFQAPEKATNDPQPISREHFQALLKAANEQWRAILLMSLNCCMYASEVAAVEKAEVDLVKGTLITDRNKTGQTRIAVLWGRTVKALKKLPPNGHTHLFLSIYKAPYDPEGMRTAFRKLRVKAGVPATVKFNNIRDGAYTAAIEAGADPIHAQLLAGHATGIKDHYVKRNARMVTDACSAIEKAYFG